MNKAVVFGGCAAGLLALGAGLFAQGGPVLPGDPARRDFAAADVRSAWAMRAMDSGRWDEALAVLENGADFADVSSDISFLLAMARLHLNRPRGAVLEALSLALAADAWNRCRPEDAYLAAAETLLTLRLYGEALAALARLPDGLDAACLRLRTLRASGDAAEFRRQAQAALDRYPREPEPLAILFGFLLDRTDYAGLASAGRGTGGGGRRAPALAPADLALLDTALSRVPGLLEAAPELAWQAAAFTADTAAARDLAASYRSGGLFKTVPEGWRPSLASLPVALNLGLADDEEAARELFDSGGELPRTLIETVWGLLRGARGRALFREHLAGYSGVITIDEDGDGVSEASARYAGGLLTDYRYDGDQDGLAELTLRCEEDEPREAVVAGAAALAAAAPARADGRGAFPGAAAFPASGDEHPSALVRYEKYPAAFDARLGGARYVFRQSGFFFAPVKFRDFLGSGLLLPERVDAPALSRRALALAAVFAERPSREFPGAVERVELRDGIPLAARETAGGLTLSETRFQDGKPLLQWIDLDGDGRRETVRRFKPAAPRDGGEAAAWPLDYALDFVSAESDWDGDGVFEAQQEEEWKVDSGKQIVD
ncbi:MAG: hypothetical protein MdMp014T_1827 [Treponematales bacterium]